MTDARTITETRIESIADAFENLSLGLTAKQIARSRSTDGVTPPILDKFVVEARAELRSALREFLKPIVRIASGSTQ